MPVKIRTPLEKSYFRNSLSSIGGKISPPVIELEVAFAESSNEVVPMPAPDEAIPVARWGLLGNH